MCGVLKNEYVIYIYIYIYIYKERERERERERGSSYTWYNSKQYYTIQ